MVKQKRKIEDFEADLERELAKIKDQDAVKEQHNRYQNLCKQKKTAEKKRVPFPSAKLKEMADCKAAYNTWCTVFNLRRKIKKLSNSGDVSTGSSTIATSTTASTTASITPSTIAPTVASGTASTVPSTAPSNSSSASFNPINQLVGLTILSSTTTTASSTAPSNSRLTSIADRWWSQMQQHGSIDYDFGIRNVSIILSKIEYDSGMYRSYCQENSLDWQILQPPPPPSNDSTLYRVDILNWGSLGEDLQSFDLTSHAAAYLKALFYSEFYDSGLSDTADCPNGRYIVPYSFSYWPSYLTKDPNVTIEDLFGDVSIGVSDSMSTATDAKAPDSAPDSDEEAPRSSNAPVAAQNEPRESEDSFSSKMHQYLENYPELSSRFATYLALKEKIFVYEQNPQDRLDAADVSLFLQALPYLERYKDQLSAEGLSKLNSATLVNQRFLAFKAFESVFEDELKHYMIPYKPLSFDHPTYSKECILRMILHDESTSSSGASCDSSDDDDDVVCVGVKSHGAHDSSRMHETSRDSSALSIATPNHRSIVGLHNLSSTCFINSALQMLFWSTTVKHAILRADLGSVEILANRISKYPKQKFVSPTTIQSNPIDSHHLANGLIELQSLFRKLHAADHQYVNPRSFIDSLGYQYHVQDDASEVFVGVLMFYTSFLGCHDDFATVDVSYSIPQNVFQFVVLLRERCYNLDQWLLKQDKLFEDNLAPVLTFQLDRSDEYGVKINTPFQYPDELCMDGFCIDGLGVKYSLRSIICHDGSSLQSGHYYFFVRNQVTNSWCEINDATVRTHANDAREFRRGRGGAVLLQYVRMDSPCIEIYKKDDAHVSAQAPRGASNQSVSGQSRQGPSNASANTRPVNRNASVSLFNQASRGASNQSVSGQSRQGPSNASANTRPVNRNASVSWFNQSSRGASDAESRSNVSRPHIASASRSQQWSDNFNPPPEADIPMLALSLFEDGQKVCAICLEAFILDDIIVVDTSFSSASTEPIHLSCWDAKCSGCHFIQDTLKKRTRATRLDCLSSVLRSANVPIAGWEKLSCLRRLPFVQRVFASMQSCIINPKDIAQYFPCGNCASCNHSKYCSYPSCTVPDIDPNKCSSCRIKTAHRLCQTNHEISAGSLQSSDFCVDCHPSNKPDVAQTRSRTSGTTRTFVSSRSRTNRSSPPIIFTNTPREDRCCNCKRFQLTDPDSPYRLNLHHGISSATQLRKATPASFSFLSSTSKYGEVFHTLCDECYNVCVEGSSDFKHTYPAWIWKLFTSNIKSTFFGDTTLSELYRDDLWRIVPVSMRSWWLDSVRSINRHGDFIFSTVTVDEPPSYFTDRTVEYSDYNNNMESEKFGGFTHALRNQKINLPNVYCPFQCTDHCEKCDHAYWDVIVQYALKMTPIPLSNNDHSKNLRNFEHMHDAYFRKDNDYDCILLNPDWPILPTLVIDEDNGPIILTCSLHGNGSDLYKLYAPRPIHHNLCSRTTDQLSHVTIKPRTIKPTQRKKFCTTFAQSKLHGTFSGVDSCWVGTNSNWNENCPILCDHEMRSIAGRSDILHLLYKKVKDRSLTEPMAEMLVDCAAEEYPLEIIQPYIDGSTFVPIEYVFKIQVSRIKEARSGAKIEAVDKKGDVNIVNRPWPRFINLIQKEDSQGYGQMFRTIPPLNSKTRAPSMTPLYLLSMVSSVNKLWELIDSKPGQWLYNEMEGNLLAFLRSRCFSFLRRPCSSKCPFNGSMTNDAFIKIIQNLQPPLPDFMLGHNSHYSYSTVFMRSLFNEDIYPTIDVIGGVEDLYNRDEVFYSSKEVIIMAMESIPDVDELQSIGNGLNYRDDVSFSLLHISIARAETCATATYQNSSKFDFIRFMRHPGYSRWWKQERTDKFVTKCDDDHDPFILLESFGRHSDAEYITSLFVFVRDQDFKVDEFQMLFLESLGGKIHLRCRCNEYPLVPTFRTSEKKLKCMKCSKKKESFICCKLQCQTRLCKACYDSYPTDDVTYIDPCQSNAAADPDSNVDCCDSESESSDDEEEEEVAAASEDIGDDNSVASNTSDSTPKPLPDFELDGVVDDEPDLHAIQEADRLVFNEFDACQYDEIEDSDAVPFYTTDAGDEPATFDMADADTSYHPGYIMLNNVSSCLTRNGKKQINPCQRDRFMIQSLVSTTKGEATPLTYPEAAMFPRHFPQAASNDSTSVLGALPLFAVGIEARYYGFESAAVVTRQRLTASGSTMSTDTHYVKHRSDVALNMVLSHSDSSHVIQRDFLVDKSSATGLAHNKFDESRLSDSVQSNMMILGLCASQAHIKNDLFGTITCNQSRTPGTDFVFEWVRSDEWVHQIRNYHLLSGLHKLKYEKCMDEASSFILLRQWLQYRSAFLRQMLKKINEHGGKTLAYTFRDEYQKEEGNLPHCHFILAVDKSDMGPNAEEMIMDMIRTSPYDVVRPDDVQVMINEGLMKDKHDMNEYTGLAAQILTHKCNPRCQMRIGDGDGPENFKCRKPHPVFDTPSPSKHTFVEIPVNFSSEFNEAMIRMGFCQMEDGTPKFNLPFFTPRRHFPPCIPNCRYNMSPVLPAWFLASESMVNAQYIGSKDSLSKYLFKYIIKDDVDQRVETSVNIKDGSIQTETIFQHNTKIATSKFNEEKAAAKSKKKNNVKGRIIANLELLQRALLEPDLHTNHKFEVVNTRDFESRQRSKIVLKDSGKVRRDKNKGRTAEGFEREPDHYYDEIEIDKTRRSIRSLSAHQQFTRPQLDILFDNRIDTRKYDKISEFGTRPPELVPIFTRPREYFRFCKLSKNVAPNIKYSLCGSVRKCRWIDGFGRMVRLRKSILSEVAAHVNSNLEELNRVEEPTAATYFARDVNRAILFMIRLYHADDSTLSDSELQYKNEGHLDDFIVDEGFDLPPTVIHSQINPMNAQQWLIHLILAHGQYITEQDALEHGSLRECLVKTKLIGESTDMEELEEYSYNVCALYVEHEVQLTGLSLNKAELYILRALRILQDVIMHNSLPMFEIPFTHSQLHDITDLVNESFWPDSNRKVLDTVYHVCRNIPNLPPRPEVEAVPHMGQLPGDFLLSEQLVRSPNQSPESFEEQKEAFKLIEYTIKKRCNAVQGRACSTYVKNAIVHGAPGSGKTFVGYGSLLLCIASGLRVLPTAIQAARAVVIGGVHLHPLLCLPVFRGNEGVSPTRMAELALRRIMNNPNVLYVLITLEVLFVDETGQVSAEVLNAIDIILRKARQSTALYGGVTIIGTLDHTQLHPIKQTPFLCSSHILGGYTFVQLKKSVRAHSDPDLQIIQALTREDPFVLQQSTEKKATWFELMDKILICADDHTDSRITSNAKVVYSRRTYARDFIEQQTDRNIDNCRRHNISHEVVRSRDFVKRTSLVEWTRADAPLTKRMNTHFREPEKLVFTEYGLFECTYNALNRDFLHTNRALMVSIPDHDTIRSRKRIKMLLVPSHLEHIEFLDSPDRSTYPTEAQLIDEGWKVIYVHCIEREENVGNVRTKRKQYTIKHIGAGTIDSVQGATIYSTFVFECTLRNRPWMKSQVVVLLSRVLHHLQMLCVGKKAEVIQHLWNLICTPNQYTRYMERKLHLLSINSEGNAPDRYTLDVDSVLPYRISEYQLPILDTGYVYLCCSMRVSTYDYIGETKSIRKRLAAHNSGNGAFGTKDPDLPPFYIAGFISGFEYYDKVNLLRIEKKWRRHRNTLDDRADVLRILRLGEKIVADENQSNLSKGSLTLLTFTSLVAPA